jgi:signal transduction histidine kinase
VARQAIHLRDEFLSIAAHELKTPVTALMGYTQVLQRRLGRSDSVSERDLRALGVIAEQAERLGRLTFTVWLPAKAGSLSG